MLAGDAARAHGTPAQSALRELELQLRATAQQARARPRRPMKNLTKIGLGILTSVGGYLEVGSMGTVDAGGCRVPL